LQAKQFVLPVAAEIERHHLGPEHRIDRRPRLGLEARDPEFGRQHGIGSEESVHARGIRREQLFRFRVEVLKISFRRAAKPDRKRITTAI
jgi:hypothetical protein